MLLTNSYGFDVERDGTSHAAGSVPISMVRTAPCTPAPRRNFKVLPEGDFMKGKAAAESIPPSPGHEREWLDCIKSRQQPSRNPAYHIKVDVPRCLSVLAQARRSSD